MSATKKRAPVNPRAKQKEQVNKKALIWIGVIFVVVVAIVATLLIWNP
jgi:flagellar basal body-associated protein FliL